MADYYINSDLGKERINKLNKVGDRVQMSDGTVVKKTENGWEATKNGQTMNVQVGVSPTTSPPSSTSTTATDTGTDTTPNIETPVLNEAQGATGTGTSSTTSEMQTPELSASQKAKNATENVTQGLYTIGTELGMSYMNQLQNAGDSKLLSDGTTLKREQDGGYSATKNGQTVGVYVDNDAVRRDSLMNEAIRGAFGQSNVYTVGTQAGLDLLQQVKDSRQAASASDNSEWHYNGDNGFAAVVNGKEIPITVDRDAIAREAAQKKSAQEQALDNVAPDTQQQLDTTGSGTSGSDTGLKYVIGSALGVLRVDKLKPGDRMKTTDGTMVYRNDDGSYTAKRNGISYDVTIDRASAMNDPQWAILTAPPASSDETETKKKKKTSTTGSGTSGSGTGSGYSYTGTSYTTSSSGSTSASGTDKASLRKQAATTEKEMNDVANQIKVQKARGKSSKDLEAKYAKLKATYDSLTEQINAVTLSASVKQALKQQTYDEYSKEMEAENKTYSAAQRAAAADRAAAESYEMTSTPAPEIERAVREKAAERARLKAAQAPSKAEQALLNAEQEYNTIPQTSAQSKTGSARAVTQAQNTAYNKAYRDVWQQQVDAYKEAYRALQAKQAEKEDAERQALVNASKRLGFGSGKSLAQAKREYSLSESEFSRSPAMVQQYGTYQNYLEGKYAGYDEAVRARQARTAANIQAQNEKRKSEQDKTARAITRINELGIADLLDEYYNSEGYRQEALRSTLAAKGVTGQELSEWRNTVFNETGQFLGDLGTALFQGGLQQAQSGLTGALAGLEKTASKLGANKAAAWVIEDLMNAVPNGKFKDSMLEVAAGLRKNTGTSSYEQDANELRQQLAQTMQDTTQNHSGAAKWVIEQAPSMGNMMLGAGASGALGVPNLATLATTAGGSAYMDAVNDGASHEQALAYGLATGAMEAASEKLFGGNPLVDTDAGWVNKLVSKATKNQTILNILDSKGFDLLSEGLEEAITEVTEPWAQALIYKGKDADFATLESTANAFLGGVFMSAVGNVAALPAEIANRDMIDRATESAYVQAMQGADAQLQKSLQEVRAKILTGAELTAEDLGKVLEAASKAGKTISPEQVARDISKTETREADWDTAMQQVFRGETATAPAQAANTQNRQTASSQQNTGAQGVITGAETSKTNTDSYVKDDGREIVKQLRRNIPELSGESSVARLSGNEFQKGTRKLTEQVGDFFRSLGNKVFRQGLGDVILDERGVKSDIGHGIGRAKAITFAAVPDVIENGKQIDFQQNWKGRGYDTYVFAAPVDIGDSRTYVAAVVRSDAQNRLYLHEVVDGNGNLIYKHENAPTVIKTGVTTERGVTGTVEASESFPVTTVPQSGQTVKQNVSANNDMGAMRSQFDSQRKQSQTQSNTINALEEQWGVPEDQRTPLYYDTISEKQSLNNARMRLAQDYAGEVAELRGKHNWSGEEVDMGMTILDNYRRAAEETGDWTEYSKWRKEVQRHGTEAGQALQAYAKYSRQTGGGIVADASAALEKAAKKTNKAEVMNRVSELANRYDTAIGTGKENVEVNVDDLIQIIRDASTTRQTGTLIGNKFPPIVNWAMNRIANYARAEAQGGGGKNLDFLKAFAADSIYNIAADTNKASVTAKIKETRRLGMLSKVSTVMRNLVSNNVFDPIDSIARNMSIPLDMLISKFTGTRSVAYDASWFSKAKRRGSMDGLARACMEVGLDVNTSGKQGRYENTTNRTFKMSDGVFSKLMSTWEAYEGYTLNATDEFQKGGIEASVQQGIDKLYEKGKIKDDSLRNAGEQEALYRTYQDETALSDVAIGVRSGLNKIHVGDIGLGDVVLPFAQVPSNLGARAIEYSPAGLLVSAADFINMIDSASKGEMTAAQQAKAVQGVGRALTGSGMIAIAAAGALRGWINVAGDDDDDDKAALDKIAGLNGTQLNISAALRDLKGESVEWQAGDKLISIGFLDPINAQLTTGALIADDIRDDKFTAGRVIGNSLSGALQSVLDMPLMSVFSDIETAYKYSSGETDGEKILDTASRYAAGQVSSMIPNSIRGIAQGLDDTERDAYTSDDYWQQAVDNVKASIPGLREALPAKTDSWGNEVKNEGGIQNFLNRNIRPGNVTTYMPEDVAGELETISKSTGESLYPARSAPKSITVNQQNIPLSYEQKNAYKAAYGTDYYKTVQTLMEDNNYQELPDEVKAEVLKQAESIATGRAKELLDIGYEMKDADREIAELSGTDRANALIAKAVKAADYISPETQQQLDAVNKQYGNADYLGLSGDLFESAREKTQEFYKAVEASKYGGELSTKQQELLEKEPKEIAQYFMDKAVESKFDEDTNGSGDKYDEVLDAYNAGDINDTVALAFLPDDTSENYRRYSQKVGVKTNELLEAQHVKSGLHEKTDADGKVTQSVQDQFDNWLKTKTNWSAAKKEALQNVFWPDHTTTYQYLSEQLRSGNMSQSKAKEELTPTYQAGWSNNVKASGATMSSYLDCIVEYENRPSEEEREALHYDSVWEWYCDYLNTTSLTKDQKYAIAISVKENGGEYSDKTKKKIYDRLK